MTSRKKPGVQRRRLGSKLRQLREQADISVETVMDELDWSRSKLSRIETAINTITVPDVRALCGLYGADGELTDQLVRMSKQAKKKGWWHAYSDALTDYFNDYIELESEATSVTNYQIDLIPGLLQTSEYAHAVIEAWTPDITKDVVDRRTELRIARQRQLDGELKLWAVIDESALRRRCGDDSVMARQLRHVREMADRPNVTVQILPFEAGTHIAMGTAFTLLDFGGVYDPVVYIDNLTSALYLEEGHEVERYTLAAEHLRAVALDPRGSVARLEEIQAELSR
ncbi:XRE family transcriptional regulator [Actinopolyspora erythraea]|uniref:XRE family transcriptional regulator n=1 Tax=Actinopolyspora erythraea TaxID=414996 RepID=A0A099D9I3_9ACTN|nr:helix-turn-helix transcriptional regulator [Actinopolyspora erythraea]ASU80487.1 XRE family transcriptional regulator [Actinopolyspora erythraea]KGI82843.1 hypothetical protein IL38_02965 [Actinopolyspora erythraea]